MSRDRAFIFGSAKPFSAGNRCGGFSLVEVILALGVTSFCLVLVIGMIPLGLKTNKESRDETDAMSLVQAIVSDYRAAGVSTNASPMFGLPALKDIVDQTVSNSFWVASDAITATNQAAAKFTVFYVVNGPPAASAAPFTIGVTVVWTGNSTNGPTQVSTLCAVPQDLVSP